MPATADRQIATHSISVREQFEWLFHMPPEIEGSDAVDPIRVKPCRQTKVRYELVADFVPEFLGLTGVAILVSVEVKSKHGGRERRQEDERVRQHFQNFVAEQDRPALTGLLSRLNEDLAERKSLGGQIVVAERAPEIGTVHDHDPPRPSGWWIARRDHSKICIHIPRWREVAMNLNLQCCRC